jgi:cysteine sulfinate desulfinase/cysteine desulfurase-like protein
LWEPLNFALGSRICLQVTGQSDWSRGGAHPDDRRLPHAGVPAAAQLIQFDLAGIAVSAGSACSSGSLKTSPVLAALGIEPAAAGEVIRVSFGRDTRADEVDRFAALWTQMAGRRRAA